MKTIVFSLLFLGYTFNLIAQDSGIKGRWNIKAGYANTPTDLDMNEEMLKVHVLKNEINYGFTKVIEAGLYGGYGISIYDFDFGVVKQTIYGAKANLHILPLFMNTHNLRIDLYASGSLGGAYRSINWYSYHEKDSFITYSLEAGAAYYFKPHFGIYIETGMTRDIENNYFIMCYGLTFKF